MAENPDLMAPGQVHRVLPANRFRNISDDGRVVESTMPLPTIPAQEKKFYFCTIPTGSFHRTDGKRIGFNHGIFESELYYDQQYLDHEIADGNPYLRHATADEVRNFNYIKDPRGTLREEILSDPEITKRLEDEIMARLLRNAAPGSALANELDAMKLGGVDAGDNVKPEEVIKAGSATITPTGTAGPTPTLQGIVTTAQVHEAAAGGPSPAQALANLLAKK